MSDKTQGENPKIYKTIAEDLLPYGNFEKLGGMTGLIDIQEVHLDNLIALCRFPRDIALIVNDEAEATFTVSALQGFLENLINNLNVAKSLQSEIARKIVVLKNLHEVNS